jgi:hypothetical protein
LQSEQNPNLYRFVLCKQSRTRKSNLKAAWSGVWLSISRRAKLFEIQYVLAKNENAIDWQKATSTSLWTAQNVGTLETKGFEVKLTIKSTIG